MRLYVFPILVLLAMAASGEQVVKARLGMKPMPDDWAGSHLQRELYVRVSKQPAGNVKAPNGATPAVVFGVLPLVGKEGPVAFALDKSNGEGAYDTLHMDYNHDGSFEGDMLVKAQETHEQTVFSHPGPNLTGRFSTVAVRLEQSGVDGALDYQFSLLAVSYKEQEDHPIIRYRTTCFREGEIIVEGQSYHAYLLDLNGNGRFDDVALSYPGPTPDNDGIILSRGEIGVASRSDALSKLRVFGQEIYTVDVKPDGSELMFRVSDVPQGTLVLREAPERLEVFSDQGVFPIGGTTKAVLPVGVYELGIISFRKSDGTGGEWRLDGYSENVRLTIKPRRKTKSLLGPPLRSRVMTKQIRRAEAPWVAFKIEVTGGAGETYAWSRTDESGNRVSDPNLIIYDGHGEILESLERQYAGIDTIPPDYFMRRPVPKGGIVAESDLQLPWKVAPIKTRIPATPKNIEWR